MNSPRPNDLKGGDSKLESNRSYMDSKFDEKLINNDQKQEDSLFNPSVMKDHNITELDNSYSTLPKGGYNED